MRAEIYYICVASRCMSVMLCSYPVRRSLYCPLIYHLFRRFNGPFNHSQPTATQWLADLRHAYLPGVELNCKEVTAHGSTRRLSTLIASVSRRINTVRPSTICRASSPYPTFVAVSKLYRLNTDDPLSLHRNCHVLFDFPPRLRRLPHDRVHGQRR